MARVGVKASTKAIEYASKLTGEQLPKSTQWATVFDIVMEGFVYDIHTKCEKDGDTTTIKLFKEPGEKTDTIETFELPNSEVYDKKQCDWEWNFIYKYLTEWLMKNAKKLDKKKKKTKSKPIDKEAIKKELNELRITIKNAKIKEKHKLVEEFNKKSKLLEDGGNI